MNGAVCMHMIPALGQLSGGFIQELMKGGGEGGRGGRARGSGG